MSVPRVPRRARQRLLGIGSDRQTRARERRGDAARGRGRPDQAGHGGAPSFDGAWWNVTVQSQGAQMLAKLLAKQPPPASVAKSMIDNGGVETLLTAAIIDGTIPRCPPKRAACKYDLALPVSYTHLTLPTNREV